MLLYERINHNNGVATDVIDAATHIIESGSIRATHEYKDVDDDEMNYFCMIKPKCEGASIALVAQVAVRVLLSGKPGMSETQPNKSNVSAFR